MLDFGLFEAERIRPLKRSEYDRLVELGAFEDERLELLRGVIVAMSPEGPPHATVIERLTMLLVPLVVGRASVRVQSPIAASDYSEPEPDIAIVEPIAKRHDHAVDHPSAAHLVIEVAHSSLRKDRRVKTSIYAEAGVPEYWVVNLVDGCVEVFTDPGEGRYLTQRTYAPGEPLSPQAFGDIIVDIAQLLA